MGAGEWPMVEGVAQLAQSRSDALQGLTVMDGRLKTMVASGSTATALRDPSALLHRIQRWHACNISYAQPADATSPLQRMVAGHGTIATQFFNSRRLMSLLCQPRSKIGEMYMTKKAPYSAHRRC